jgi:hypothetical protein
MKEGSMERAPQHRVRRVCPRIFLHFALSPFEKYSSVRLLAIAPDSESFTHPWLSKRRQPHPRRRLAK